ncbi:polyphosphate:AMP phosphotransferase [Methylicorpusculum sp.]|uniref:polyphosphate:AMP phosphotransferase n=1 Tax=Methylicorpusculum sp. TaxID=2713644 RepID=UPI0027227B2F|nr:polyphosphate:AMP phosphotransferase [Methylicorpusculum sp.]MDO8844402.1 polyphosphate:AMP phosphotransferase [Methylicorpusculum sp.]
MFEIAELGHTLKKTDYNEQVPELRTQLLLTQQKLMNCDFPVIILISGVDGGGKGEVINLLNEWMDPRYMQTIAFDEPSDEEKERPKFWRFWRTLPSKGSIGIFVGSWYSDPLSQRVYGEIDDNQLQIELMNIKELERLLFDDGALIIKCWLHLKKDEQKKRIKNLEKNPETNWQVTERDKKHLKLYDDFIGVAEKTLTETSTGDAPWLIVDGSDIRYSSFSVGQHVLHRIEQHIEDRTAKVNSTNKTNGTARINPNQQSLLDSLDLSLKIDKKSYNEQLDYYQSKLKNLARIAQQQKRSCILVFEGWDAGGKGGAIRRITHAVDARNYRVIPVAAPTDEERSHHYLWRFWRHIPRAGKVTLYDRSWYGRVLVERVEGFASVNEWQRAYSEIANFEDALVRHGILLLKFWLHIDKDEQLKRFHEREQISYKKYKITEDDYRNREKWDDYKHAVNEMVTRTSTRSAPWLLVEGNDKKYARIKILKAYCEKLESSLQLSK